jgi:hypothetical protein
MSGGNLWWFLTDLTPKNVIFAVHANKDLTGEATSRELKIIEFAPGTRTALSSNPATCGARRGRQPGAGVLISVQHLTKQSSF